MNSEFTQCDDQQLVAILRHDDMECQDGVLLEHVESCERCQSRLRQMAAEEHDWQKATSALATSPSIGDQEDEEGLSRAKPRFMRWSNRPNGWDESMAKHFLDPPNHPEMLGRLGRYEIERLVGSGGMGVVFKAHDTELNRPVAIKLLAPYLAGNDSARVRFAREARAAAGVVDDHVVPIFNVESENDPPFLVMQYVAGGSLQEVLDRDGSLEVAEVLRIGMQTAKGLSAAHAQGLIHRDVKPSNILLDEGVERALLTDFGLARTDHDASLTRSGFHPGTPHYMSPEQVRGEAIDGRSDLFGLGCVLYSLCTGHPPFQAETSYAVLRRITDDTARPIRELNSKVPDWLEAIVMKLLSKSRDDRFHSAEQVAELLAKCLSHLTAPITNPLPQIMPRLSWLKRCVKTMNNQRTHAKQTKVPSVIFWTIGCAVFFVSFVLAASSTGTIANWYWDSLGILYGTSLYFSGLAALYVACRSLWNPNDSASGATAIPVALLPAFIGLVGSVHGYISVHHSVSNLGASLDQADMSFAHVTVLTSFLVGLCFSIVPLIIISLKIFSRRNSQQTMTQ